MTGNPSDHRGPDNPVESISWDEANQFCRKEGLRLPTEAQWEYACRAGSDGPYAGPLDKLGWFLDNSGEGETTHPVQQKLANAWGIYDMHGNVREWCADWYGPYADGKDPVSDPQGPGTGEYRVARGGSVKHNAANCRSAARFAVKAASESIGFRPVKLLD